MSKISIIIPCYYNELNILSTSKELLENESRFPLSTEFEYIMIDDGSKDNTLKELLKFKELYPQKVKVIKLSGNFGSYNAILAGMNYATGDCNVVISADLQDPPELIEKMYTHWQNGIKLVIANRSERKDSFVQKIISGIYHKLFKKFALNNIPDGGFDFVLFDKQLKDEVVSINEKNTNTLFLLSWLKYEYVNIPYTRKKREIGKSKWTLQKKIKLFIDSFVAFSYFPLRMITVFGIILSICSFLYGIFIIIAKLTGIINVQGWAAFMAILLFVSSFQMLALGILGEYLWRTLDATRNRPNFVIDKVFL